VATKPSKRKSAVSRRLMANPSALLRSKEREGGFSVR